MDISGHATTGYAQAPARPYRTVLLLLAAVALVGLTARLLRIDQNPLWLDEAYSLWYAEQPLSYLWTVATAYEPHPPLYYSLLHAWIDLFGSSDSALRALSVALNLGALPFIYLTGRRLGGSWAGLAAALVFALMPLQVEWSQNVRAYGPAALPVAALIWGIVEVTVRHGTAIASGRHGTAVAVGRTGTAAAWAAVTLGSAGLLWLHNSYPLVILSVQILVLIWWLTAGGRDWTFARNWVLANAVAFLLWSPWLPNLFLMMDRVGDGFVIPEPTLANTISAIALFFTANDFWHFTSGWAVPDLAYFGFGLIGAALLFHRRRWLPALLLAGLCGLPLLLYLLASLLFVPVFQPKLLVWTGVPFAILVGYGLSSLPDGRWRAGMLGLVAAALFAGTQVYYSKPPREGWVAAAERLARSWRPGEPVLTISMTTALPLSRYLDRLGASIPLAPMPTAWPNADKGFQKILPEHRDIVQSTLEGADRAWLVVRHSSRHADPTGLIQAELERFGRRAGLWDMGNVDVALYVRHGAAIPPAGDAITEQRGADDAPALPGR